MFKVTYDKTRQQMAEKCGLKYVDKVLHSEFGSYVGFKSKEGKGNAKWHISEERFWEAARALSEGGR